MKSLKRIFYSSCFFLVLFSCKQDSKIETVERPSVNQKEGVTSIIKKEGCNNQYVPCFDFKIEFPSFDKYPAETKEEVEHTIKDYLSDFLVAEKPIQTDELTTYIEETIHAITEASNESTTNARLKLHSLFTILFENEQLLCLKNNYDFNNSQESIMGEGYFIFNLKSNELLYVDDIIKDFNEIEQRLLKRVKEQNNVPLSTNIKELGYLLEDQDFAITDNIGITDDKLFFTYLPQEIAPNSSGLIRFVLNKDDVRNHLNVNFLKMWETP